MELLYNFAQQSVLNKLNRNEVLTLLDVKVIIDDVNTYKLSQLPGIDIDTKTYCLDRNLVNQYISTKYSDSIFYYDKFNNLNRLYF